MYIRDNHRTVTVNHFIQLETSSADSDPPVRMFLCFANSILLYEMGFSCRKKNYGGDCYTITCFSWSSKSFNLSAKNQRKDTNDTGSLVHVADPAQKNGLDYLMSPFDRRI